MAGPSTASKMTGNQNTNPVRTNATGLAVLTTTGGIREEMQGHGARVGWYLIDEEVTLSLVGATSDTTALIPVGTIHVYTATRVTTTLAGNSVSNYSLGKSGSATLFQGTTTNITAGDTNCGSSQPEGTTPYTSATAIRITADQTVTSGKIRVVAWCLYICPPTS